MTFTNITDHKSFLAANAGRACTFEDMSNALYSDIYKETYGCRPHDTVVPFATVGDLYTEIDRLIASGEEQEQYNAECLANCKQEETDANDLDLIAQKFDWLTIS